MEINLCSLKVYARQILFISFIYNGSLNWYVCYQRKHIFFVLLYYSCLILHYIFLFLTPKSETMFTVPQHVFHSFYVFRMNISAKKQKKKNNLSTAFSHLFADYFCFILFSILKFWHIGRCFLPIVSNQSD